MSTDYDFGPEYTKIKENKEKIDVSNDNGWSIASFIVSLFSVICCPFLIFGIVFGVLGIIFAAISSKRRGEFDGLSMSGMVLGIFGVVLGIASIVFLVLMLIYSINL